MIKTHSFETTDALIKHTEDLLRTTLATAGTSMLSGGSTPYAVYDRLTRNPCPVHPDRRLFLSDERMVPADSPDSNTGNLTLMLGALKCNDRFARIDTTLSIADSAACFASMLENTASIDLGLLGMGTDGHTAGIFTPEQAAMKAGELTLYTQRPDGLQGISVTPVVFQKTERIILLVTGEAKRNVIHTLLEDPQSIPAGIALADHPDTELWTDIRL